LVGHLPYVDRRRSPGLGVFSGEGGPNVFQLAVQVYRYGVFRPIVGAGS